jgi:hypothetical protein
VRDGFWAAHQLFGQPVIPTRFLAKAVNVIGGADAGVLDGGDAPMIA